MSQQPITTKILADAFLHYPLMKYAFEERAEEERSKSLHELYKCCTSACNKYGGVITTDDKQGALIWLSGKNFPLGLMREIKSDMWTIPFQLGVKPTLRLMNHDNVPEGWIKKNAGEKMGYIWCVGVNAKERGKGHSKKLPRLPICTCFSQKLNGRGARRTIRSNLYDTRFFPMESRKRPLFLRATSVTLT